MRRPAAAIDADTEAYVKLINRPLPDFTMLRPIVHQNGNARHFVCSAGGCGAFETDGDAAAKRAVHR